MRGLLCPDLGIFGGWIFVAKLSLFGDQTRERRLPPTLTAQPVLACEYHQQQVLQYRYLSPDLASGFSSVSCIGFQSQKVSTAGEKNVTSSVCSIVRFVCLNSLPAVIPYV